MVEIVQPHGDDGIVIGSTIITGGTDTRVLFNDGGFVGEDAGFIYNKTTDFATLVGGLISPKIIGGTSTTQDLSFQTTSGVGATGADMHFLVGNNGATEAMTILNSGNVGIGTTNPLQNLVVTSGTNAGFEIAVGSGIVAQSYNRTSSAYTSLKFDGLAIGFRPSGTEAMSIIAGGNVGIGTTSPTGLLHVAINDGSANADRFILSQSSSGDVGMNFELPGVIGYRMGIDNSDSDKFKIGTSVDLGASNLFTLQSNGNVGILTASPSFALDVNSNIIGVGTKTASSGLGGQIRYRDDTGTARWLTGISGSAGATLLYNSYNLLTDEVYITTTAGGMVGIGTNHTAPKQTLSVASSSLGAIPTLGSSASTGQFSVLGDSAAYGLRFGVLTSGNTFIQSDRVDGAATAYNMLLQPNGGNVGIGTTAPTAVLHLKAGTATANTAPLKFTSGTLNTVTVAGQHEYNGNHYLTNVGLLRMPVGGTLFDHYTDSTVGGAEADIFTNTLLANTFNGNGDKVVAMYSGNFVTVGTELTQLQVYLAGTSIWDSTGVAPTTGTTSWKVNVELIRVSSTVVRYTVSLNTTGASGYVYAKSGELTGLTLSGTNILKITGTSSGVGSGSGDIVGKMGYVEFKPAS